MKQKKFEEIKEMLKKTHILHHDALERGYQPAKNYKITLYEGRFGKGFKLAYPTKESRCGNRYHRIEYYIN